jgi:acyl-CoA synthetase (AMP-forming)/AMP-acid ligase II
VAYYLPRTAIGPGELRRLAARHLPAYLVPAAFVEVDTFPTTPSGKLDPAALPAGAYVPGSPSVPRLSG